MFGKLLMHDFRATAGVQGAMALVSLFASVLGMIIMRNGGLLANTASVIDEVLVIALMLMVVFWATYTLMSAVIQLNHFYRSRFCDEGYLTFTLPVSSHQILLSGFLTTLFWIPASLLVTGLSVGGMMFFGLAEMDGQRMAFLKDVFQRLPAWLPPLEVSKLLGLAFLSLIAELITVMTAITVGSLFGKKHRLLTGIVFYGVVSAVSTAVSLWIFAMLPSGTAGFSYSFPVVGIAVNIVIAAGGYFLMHYLVSRKLNLT